MNSRRAALKTVMAGAALAIRPLAGVSTQSAAGPEAMLARVSTFQPGELGGWMRFEHKQRQADFLMNLEMARAVYRRCPELVKAAGFDMIPADMLKAYRSVYEYEPLDARGFDGETLLDSDYNERLTEHSRHMVKLSAAKARREAAKQPEPEPEPETRESLQRDLEEGMRFLVYFNQHVNEHYAELEQKIATFAAA